jgi:type II secretory pathway component PulF
MPGIIRLTNPLLPQQPEEKQLINQFILGGEEYSLSSQRWRVRIPCTGQWNMDARQSYVYTSLQGMTRTAAPVQGSLASCADACKRR